MKKLTQTQLVERMVKQHPDDTAPQIVNRCRAKGWNAVQDYHVYSARYKQKKAVAKKAVETSAVTTVIGSNHKIGRNGKIRQVDIVRANPGMKAPDLLKRLHKKGFKHLTIDDVYRMCSHERKRSRPQAQDPMDAAMVEAQAELAAVARPSARSIIKQHLDATSEELQQLLLDAGHNKSDRYVINTRSDLRAKLKLAGKKAMANVKAKRALRNDRLPGFARTDEDLQRENAALRHHMMMQQEELHFHRTRNDREVALV